MSVLAIVGTVVGVIAGVAALVALVAAMWARFRTSSDETTAALWKGEADAWKSKAERLEQGFADLARRVEHLEQENRILRQLHDNRQEMTDLRHAITDGFAGMAALMQTLEDKK